MVVKDNRKYIKTATILKNKKEYAPNPLDLQLAVVISSGKTQICQKKFAMKTKDDAYAAFERLMNEKEIFRDETLSFEDICAEAEADPEELEKRLIAELGYRGEELVSAYRRIEKVP